MSYDTNGNLLTQTDAKGQTITPSPMTRSTAS